MAAFSFPHKLMADEPNMPTIQIETPEHQQEVRRVTKAAFAASQFGHNGEADLIDAIRDGGHQCVSLVAIHEDLIVGHILISPVTIQYQSQALEGMGLAPMAVLPKFQRGGIGSQLVTSGLELLATQQSAFTVVAGDPNFYSRFGFQPASEFGVSHGFDGMPQEFFMVRPASDGSLDGIKRGLAYYVAEFGPQHAGHEQVD